jgi:hypothetical protein
MTTIDVLAIARAEALFTSPLSASVHSSRAQVTAAIRTAVRAYGGTRGCAIEVAGAYGDHPETAAPRMRWACGVVETVYAELPGAAPRWAGPTRQSWWGMAAPAQ